MFFCDFLKNGDFQSNLNITNMFLIKFPFKKCILLCTLMNSFKGYVQYKIVTGYIKRYLKGTNGRQKTYEIFHVYCILYSGFMCQTTVIFGITKDGSLVLNTLAS